jgi:translation initiation factor IF-2
MQEAVGPIRLSKAAVELNVSKDTILDFLSKKGFQIENNPNYKLTEEMHHMVRQEFKQDLKTKQQSEQIVIGKNIKEKQILEADKTGAGAVRREIEQPQEILVKNLNKPVAKPTPTAKPVEQAPITMSKPEAEVEPIVPQAPPVEPETPKAEVIVETPKVEAVVEPKIEVVKEEVVKPTPPPQPMVEPVAEPAIEPVAKLVSVPVESAPVIEESPAKTEDNGSGLKILGKIDLSNIGNKPNKKSSSPKAETPKPQAEAKKAEPKVSTETKPQKQEPKAESSVPSSKEETKTPQATAADNNSNEPTAINETTAHEKAERVANETPSPETPSADQSDATVPEKDDEVIRATAERLVGTTVIGKIDLSQFERKKSAPVASSTDGASGRKRKRIDKPAASSTQPVNRTGGGNQQNNQQGGGQNRNRGPQQGGQNRPGGNNQQGGGGQNRPGGNNQQGGNRGGGPQGNRNNNNNNNQRGNRRNQPAAADAPKAEITEKQIQDQIKATMARMSGQAKFGRGKSGNKKSKRDSDRDEYNREMQNEDGKSVIQATEFLTTAELAQLMDVSVTEVISNCFGLGIVVSINQRLDAETITVVADEFGYDVEFVSAIEDEPSLEEEDDPESQVSRPPIVTIMGHVDHGKTSLLDYIRNTNVIAGEAGGITQHIGAYEVTLKNGKQITFLDTPGHEAFTAMRARGAKVTDIVVVVIAADDSVMPQTKEAISHAQAAGVPIIFAINKIDRPEAQPDRIREQLAQLNILVESWGGKYQDQEISAKKGLNVDDLLEKILLEAEMLDLKADPERRALGTVIEASLDKGKGIVTTVLIQTGTIEMGDTILAGQHFGRVKALMNERGQRIKRAGPSTPVQILGFNAAPTAGDRIYVTENEAQAKEIAARRQQLAREQDLRTKKHITLDEIGRRLAVGNFKELNVIVKGDVDGSIEALADSLQRLSTDKIQVNIIYKGVGQISESDVLLASASDAIIVGFQVRPLPTARKLAEQEEIDIRLYSIIYDAIEEIKSAMEGMLAPTYEEKVTCNIEIRETFKISKVGTIAGCYVLDGKVNRNTKVRIIRDGVVIFTGELASLKRFKDDVKEVNTGYECGLNINNFNDIKVGDIIEGYERVEVKSKL